VRGRPPNLTRLKTAACSMTWLTASVCSVFVAAHCTVPFVCSGNLSSSSPYFLPPHPHILQAFTSKVKYFSPSLFFRAAPCQSRSTICIVPRCMTDLFSMKLKDIRTGIIRSSDTTRWYESITTFCKYMYHVAFPSIAELEN